MLVTLRNKTNQTQHINLIDGSGRAVHSGEISIVDFDNVYVEERERIKNFFDEIREENKSFQPSEKKNRYKAEETEEGGSN